MSENDNNYEQDLAEKTSKVIKLYLKIVFTTAILLLIAVILGAL